MEKAEKVIITNMCMIYDDCGRVLVQNRIASSWSGIAFPGGHTEKNEAITDSVIREIYEETGLTVSELQFCGIKEWFPKDGERYIVFLYKTNCFKGKITSSDEGEVFWVTADELPKLNLASGMKYTLEVFLNDNVNEEFITNKNGDWIHILK